MTSGPAPVPIRSFQDVIDRGYRVVVRGSTSNHEFLKTAREGTPMHEYYYKHMQGDPEAFTSSIEESLDAMTGETKTLFFAQAMNIIGDADDFESIIMEDTIWSQVPHSIENHLA